MEEGLSYRRRGLVTGGGLTQRRRGLVIGGGAYLEGDLLQEDPGH